MTKFQNTVLKYTKADKVDVILLPEMAFTGYTFKDAEDILPYAEEQRGPQFQFLSKIAKIMNAYIFCGYPEIAFAADKKSAKLYNSAYLVDRSGELLLNYRKTFLFETDKTWAAEGDGFKVVELTNCLNQKFTAGLAICMDINPYEFKDNSKFELATFCKEKQIDALLFLANWNDHDPEGPEKAGVAGIMDYWLWRLTPLINKKFNEKEKPYKSWCFFCADRVGAEDALQDNAGKTHFIGSSCCIKLNPFELVYNLGKKNEGVLAVEVKLEKQTN